MDDSSLPKVLGRLTDAVGDCMWVAESTAEDKAKVELVANIRRQRITPALMVIGLELEWEERQISSVEDIAAFIQALRKLVKRLGDLIEEDFDE